MARSSHWVRRFITLVVVLAIVGTGWYFLFGKPEPPPRFQTVAVSKGSIIQAVSATGTLQPVISVDVGSQVSGRIIELHADFNSPVAKGAVLARIDPATFEAAVSQAQSELADVQARARLARANFNRSKSLYEQSLVSKADLEQSEATADQADTTAKIRQFALESRQTDLARCTIYAPIDGIVISRNTQVGQTVAASLNSPTLFVIANDLTKMQIAAAISEADVGSIEEGQNVTFTVDAHPGVNFRGTVAQVRNAPKTLDSVVTYETIISTENPNGILKPGMTANVSIIVAQKDDTIRLSSAAFRVRLPENPSFTIQRLTATNGGGASRAGAAAVVAAAGTTPAAAAEAPAAGENGGGRRAGRRGGNGGNGGNGGEGRIRLAALGSDRPTFRTVYKLTGSDEAPVLEEVRVRTGISDMTNTEVLDGLAEGDKIVTAVITSTAPITAPTNFGGGNNPFGGGGRGGFGGGGFGGRGR